MFFVNIHFCNSTVVGWTYWQCVFILNASRWNNPRRSLANSLATYPHPPVWSSPMCPMVWLPSQRSPPQDRVETTGSIWKSKPIYIHIIYIYTYIYINIFTYIYIYKTSVRHFTQALALRCHHISMTAELDCQPHQRFHSVWHFLPSPWYFPSRHMLTGAVPIVVFATFFTFS